MRPSSDQLKRGWTTGACATAATRAAFTALLTGEFPDPVEIVLPKGQTPSFALASEGKGEGWAQVGIVKDAGDDPDVTHGALILSTVRPGAPGSGVTFVAGEGVGTVTLPGLPIAPGEPAINPVPRAMMTETIVSVAKSHGAPADVVIEISVPDGKALAEKTWNPRLGIKGGLSVLGTTGIVNPFSCSAWIHSIHRGIDVARAAGLTHVAGSTGAIGRGSEGELCQVLMNLLSNAAEASPAGRTVRLQVRRDRDHALIYVADDGPGVPVVACDTLFEPFHTSKPDGMGLGLAIARQMVRRHGGELRLLEGPPHSMQPQPTGACFELRLPARLG